MCYPKESVIFPSPFLMQVFLFPLLSLQSSKKFQFNIAIDDRFERHEGCPSPPLYDSVSCDAILCNSVLLQLNDFPNSLPKLKSSKHAAK